MGKFTFLIAFMLAFFSGYGQVSGYTFSQSTGNTYTEITGGTVLATCTNCTTSYDGTSWVITLPAPVLFNGVMVSDVIMRSDGSLIMGSTSTSSSTGPISATTTATGGIIAPLGGDLRSAVGTDVVYETRWEELADSYVFQWKNASRWANQANDRLNFQVHISKTTGVITMAYGSMTLGTATTYQPQVGLRGTTNADFINRLLTDAIPDASPSWEDTAAGTSNLDRVRLTSASPAAFPATGLNYIWTPPTCYAPTSPAVSYIGYNTTTVQYTAPVTAPSNGYELYIATTNTAPDAATVPTGTSATTSFTFNSLTEQTVYYYWIRSNCAGTTTNWIYGGTFKTDCAPVIPPTAYVTFEDYSGSIPAPCWKEADGLLGATPITLNGTSSNWTFDDYNNTEGTVNGESAYIFLDGVDNEWITSPLFNLGDGSIDYQIEYTASVINSTGTDPVTTMDEKFVKVVVSTDGGQTWSEANVVATYNSANIPAGEITQIVNLGAYSGNVKIGFYAYSTSNDGVELRFFIDNFRIIPVPSCFNPITPQVSVIGETTATLAWTAPSPAPANGYEYYISTSDTAPTAATTATGSVGAGVLNANITSLTTETDYYAWVRSNCGPSGNSEWVATGMFTTLCDAFQILTTASTPVCGESSSTLTATVDGGTVRWYANEQGGVALGTGLTYTTPVLTESTTFYAGAVTEGTTITNAARVAPTGTAGAEPSTYGLVFDAYTAFTINSVDVYLRGSSPGTIEIALRDNTGATLETIFVDVPAGSTTAPVQHTINLGFDVPAGTGYRLLAIDGPSLVRESTLGGFPYPLGTAGQVTNGYISGTSTSYYYFYNWSLTPICAAPRVAVPVTVTPAPAIDATVTTATVCAGQSTDISVTSANAGYSYVWMPGNLSGATQTVSPTETTTYVVTGTDAISGCVTTDEVTVNVNPAPVVATITNSVSGNLCLDQVATLSANTTLTPNGVIGTGTSTNTATGAPSPYSLYFGGNKYQMLIRASELTALGFTTGSQINAVAFNVASVGADFGGTLNAFQIDMGHTTEDVLNSTAFITGLFNVLPAADVTIPTTGLPANVNHTFATPFVWNGTDNIVIQTSFSNNIDGTSAQTVQMTYTPAGFVSTAYYRDDSATPDFVLAADDPSSSTANRPNMVLTAANPALTWSPATNLYTDAAATIPYVAGTNASTVYVKSATAGTTTYTVTSTTVQSCSSAQTIDVTVEDCTIGWANLQFPADGTITTCGSHTVYGQVFKTGVTEAAGQGAGITAWVGVSSTNSDPATWTEAEWHLATFNVQAGNNDEYMYTITGLPAGTYYYATRYQYLAGPYYYGGLAGAWDAVTSTSGTLTVNGVDAPVATAAVFCNVAPTVAELVPFATGDNLQWYDVATGGTALATTTALVTGTYYVSQTVSGCESARTSFVVTINTTTEPTVADLTYCNAAPTVADIIAATTGTDVKVYDALTGGTELATTTALAAGNYYVSQTINGCEGPRATVAVTLNTTAAPTATDLVFCNAAPTVTEILATITGDNLQLYDVETGGTALEGTAAVSTATYYVSQTINGCESARDSFTITLNTTDAPAAPATQDFCAGSTVADIEVTGTATQWYSTETGDTPVALTTELTDGTIYYVSQTINGCESTRTAVTVTVITVVADEMEDVVTCGAYTLPALTNGNYFGGENGGGTAYAAGDVISSDMTMYIFSQTGECTAETSFTIDVTIVDAPTGEATQTVNEGTAPEATIEDLVVMATGTVTWYATEEDALAGTNPLAAGTEITSGDYFAVQTIDGCTSAPFAVTVTVTLDRNDFAMANVKVYPNPVVDKLVITYSSDITLVEVYNLLGQRVIVEQPNTTTATINMSNLETATYIVKVTADGMTKDVKVVKRN